MKIWTIVISILLFSSTLWAAIPQIECQTNHKSGQFFQFNDAQLVININRQDSTSRQIASSTVTFENLRTKWNGASVDKVGYFENYKHTIHIENVNHLSDVNDYISIRSHDACYSWSSIFCLV